MANETCAYCGSEITGITYFGIDGEKYCSAECKVNASLDD